MPTCCPLSGSTDCPTPRRHSMPARESPISAVASCSRSRTRWSAVTSPRREARVAASSWERWRSAAVCSCTCIDAVSRWVKVGEGSECNLHQPPPSSTKLRLSRTRQLQTPCNLSRDHCVLPSEDWHHVSSMRGCNARPDPADSDDPYL